MPELETESLQMLLVVAIAALYIPACFLIARKAGYSGWYGLLMLIPVVNLLVIYVFALSAWPIAQARSNPEPERLPNS